MSHTQTITREFREYHEFLLSRRRDLLSNLQDDYDALEKSNGTDQVSLPQMLHDQSMRIQNYRLAIFQLKMIDAALSRLDNNDFGYKNYRRE